MVEAYMIRILASYRMELLEEILICHGSDVIIIDTLRQIDYFHASFCCTPKFEDVVKVKSEDAIEKDEEEEG